MNFTLNHTTISVKDMQKSIEFYSKFGFELKKQYNDENVEIVLLENDGRIIEFFYYKDFKELPEHAINHSDDLKVIGSKHFGIGCENIYEAKKFVEENNLYNGEIEIKPGRLGNPYFFIKDPNGINVEIIQEGK